LENIKTKVGLCFRNQG